MATLFDLIRFYLNSRVAWSATQIFTGQGVTFCNWQQKKNPASRGQRGVKIPNGLTFAELEAFARTRLAVLLAFAGAGIAGQQALRLQRRTEGGIKLNEGAGQAVADGIRLTIGSPAGHVDADIKFFHGTRNGQGHGGDGALGFQREVIFKRAAVDGDFAVTGGDPDAGHRSFAASGPEKFVGFGGSHKKLVRSFEHGGGLSLVIMFRTLEYFELGE